MPNNSATGFDLSFSETKRVPSVFVYCVWPGSPSLLILETGIVKIYGFMAQLAACWIGGEMI